MNSITLIDYEIWLDWIEETYNFSYNDLEYTRIVLENNYCGQEGRYGGIYVEYPPSNGNGCQYGYGNTLPNVGGNGYFYEIFNNYPRTSNAYGNSYNYVHSRISWGNCDFCCSSDGKYAYGNGVSYIRDE